MDINQLLPAGSVDALASQLGVPREQAERGAKALLPSLVAGMGEKAGGAQARNAPALEDQLSQLGGAHLADNVLGPELTDVATGNQLLGHLFGSKDTSRQVASQASQSSGLDPSLLKKMLPILAMLLAGHMAKRSSGQQGGLGGVLGSVLGSMSGGGSGGALGGILGSVLGGRR